MATRNVICVTDKKRLVDAFDAGEDWEMLASQVKVKVKTARAIILKWRRSGTLSNGKRGGKKPTKISLEVGA